MSGAFWKIVLAATGAVFLIYNTVWAAASKRLPGLNSLEGWVLRFLPFALPALLVLVAAGCAHAMQCERQKKEQKLSSLELWSGLLMFGMALWISAGCAFFEEYAKQRSYLSASNPTMSPAVVKEMNEQYVPVIAVGLLFSGLGGSGVVGVLRTRRLQARLLAEEEAKRKLQEELERQQQRQKAEQERLARQQAQAAEAERALVLRAEQERQEEEAEQRYQAEQNAQIAAILEQAKARGAKVKIKRQIGDADIEITLDPKEEKKKQREREQRLLDDDAW